ncbi:MAG: MFS transporter [Gemmatimonadetes bacterium]|jgi:MFS family permease|nr:MFS transporter [Gemmatimonadota bacterium]
MHGPVWCIPEYRRLLLGTVVMALAAQAESLAVSWFVLLKTDSVFLTAASFAIRKIPSSLIAPLAGDISDRLPRSWLLVATTLYKAAIALLLGWLSLNDFEQLWAVFTLAALSGIGQSFEVPATQGLITDIVPRRMMLQAVALQGTAMRAIGAIGSLASGLAIHSIGAPAVLFSGAGVLAIGAAIIGTVPATRSREVAESQTGFAMLLESLRGLRWLMRRPIVGSLLWAAFVVEIFGFSYNALLPSVAHSVLNVGADGLGELKFAAGMGSVLGVAALTAASAFPRKGLLFIGITIAYGVFLAAFATSGIFPLSLALIVCVGAAAGMFDTMQMTLLQQNVPDDVRGRAIGGWMFAINFAWIGQMALGYVAESVGVGWALAGAGGLVISTGLAAFLVSPGLRRI